MNAMLLTAGHGTRFRPQTEKYAKPALPFLNAPLLAYPLYHLESLDLETLVYNTHYLPESVDKAIKQVTQSEDYEVKSSKEETEILGSGGGIAKAKEHLKGKGDFVVINGDEVFFFPKDHPGLKSILSKHQAEQNIVTHLTCPQEGLGTKFSAIWTDQDHNVIGYGKKPPEGANPKAKLTPQHFTGVHVFSEKIFDYMPPEGTACNILLDVVMKAIAAGEKVKTHYEPELLWFEMGNEQSYLEATKTCLEKLRSMDTYGETVTQTLDRMLPMYTMEFSADSQMLLGDDTDVEEIEVSGFLVAGAMTQFQQGCHLRNVVLGPGVSLTENTNAENKFIV